MPDAKAILAQPKSSGNCSVPREGLVSCGRQEFQREFVSHSKREIIHWEPFYGHRKRVPLSA